MLESPRPESTDRAIGFFERALRIDETHALSWVGLAEALLRRAGQSEGPTPYREALEAAERAVTVAPGLGSAWAARGQARWLADWDWEGAGVDFREALERAPDEGRVHLAYAFYLSATGRHEEAVHHGLESRRLAPLDPAANLDLAWLYLYARRWDQVLAESLNALALEPGLFTAHYTAAMAYRHLGEIAQAEESYLRMWRAAGAGSGRIEATRVLPVAERDEAMRQWWMTGEGATRLPAFERALISLSRGESDGVWEALSESVARREFHATMLAVDPRLDSIRDEPEFQELLAATRSVPRVLETPSS